VNVTAYGEALLAEIRENPGDDLPRLAYADWLDDTGGDLERAEFIRLDVERHARWPDFAKVCDADRPHTYPDHARLRHIESRMAVLLRVYPEGGGEGRMDWFPACEKLSAGSFRCGRGFVAEIFCPLAEWNSYGADIASKHPLVKVHLTDKQSVYSVRYWTGWRFVLDQGEANPPRWALPRWLFDELCRDQRGSWNAEPDYPDDAQVTFDTSDIAEDALSGASLRWARSVPLPA
jgi:uncharacterized protein (TIGR02996 family)